MASSLCMDTQCSQCEQQPERLIHFFDATWEKAESQSLEKLLCADCIVGKTLPVERQPGEWQMATIVEHHPNEGGKHEVGFDGKHHQKLLVASNPFKDYIASFNQRKQQYLSRASLGSLDLPWLHDDLQENPRDWTLDTSVSRTISAPIQVPAGKKSKGKAPAWTEEEDAQLVQLVAEHYLTDSKNPKWPELSRHLDGRSGKQCRERYNNHLKPELKTVQFTLLEDAALCHLFQRWGSKWSQMTVYIKGRTDNAIKNRYHQLRRRLDRDIASRNDKSVKRFRTKEENTHENDFDRKVAPILPGIALDSIDDMHHESFGPMVLGNGEICTRCAFIIPSIQSGHNVCRTTGWCESCATVPSYLVADTLRTCLSLRTG